MDEYVTMTFYNESMKRVDEENRRQNSRLKELEDSVHEIGRLTVSVEKMAVSMENMASEQKEQGDRLKAIEEKPMKRWDTLTIALITGIAGFLLNALLTGMIH